MSITIPHNFTARPYQVKFFDAMNRLNRKRAILVWNRRAGKDTCAWNYMIQCAVETRGIYYYIFPTAIQGRKVLWDGMTNDGMHFLHFLPKELIRQRNNQEMKLTLFNSSIIQIVGSDNYNSIMGTNPIGCIFSEYSLQNPNAWQYIRPILDANGGWAVFVFTPRGANHAKDLYDMALIDANKNSWFCQLLTNSDTKILSLEQLARLRDEEMSEDMIAQEWYCSFTLGIQGSYYAKYLCDMRDEGRICKVAHDPYGRVYTAWDLGLDAVAVTFWQVAGKEIHIIDYYEVTDERLPIVAKAILDKPYIYEEHFAPADSNKRQLSDKMSIRDIISDLGIEFTVLKTNEIGVDEGIECTRQILPRCYIDERKCVQLIRCLENYRRTWDDELKIYRSKPVHDRWSHGADSMRYLALAMREHQRLGEGPTDAQVEAWQDRYNPRFDK